MQSIQSIENLRMNEVSLIVSTNLSTQETVCVQSTLDVIYGYILFWSTASVFLQISVHLTPRKNSFVMWYS